MVIAVEFELDLNQIPYLLEKRVRKLIRKGWRQLPTPAKFALAVGLAILALLVFVGLYYAVAEDAAGGAAIGGIAIAMAAFAGLLVWLIGRPLVIR